MGDHMLLDEQERQARYCPLCRKTGENILKNIQDLQEDVTEGFGFWGEEIQAKKEKELKKAMGIAADLTFMPQEPTSPTGPTWIRRRMTQREHSNRRDSPVMTRLLNEIVDGQDN